MENDQHLLLIDKIHSASESSCSLIASKAERLAASKRRLPKPQPSQRPFWLLLLALILLFYIAVLTTLKWVSTSREHNSGQCLLSKEDLPYSPGNHVLKYERRRLEDYKSTLYSGLPSEEQNAAWHRLLKPTLIRVSKEDLVRAHWDPKISAELLSGDGYGAMLGVYHELHCINRIQMFLYQDFYYPNMTLEERERENRHITHCMEVLRVAAMCNGNSGLHTFYWQPNSTGRPTTMPLSERQCVDWEALVDWSRERGVGFHPQVKPRPSAAMVRSEVGH